MEGSNQVVCTAGRVYAVKAGDTFNSIARAQGVTAGELAELNPYVDVARLSVGQLLCVPGEPQARECPAGYTAGTVQAGETYADLLRRYNISYQAFRLSNPELSPTSLTAGQRYCVPPEGTRRICPGGASSYIIGADETLDSIAAKLNVTPGRLLRLNPSLAPSDFEEGRQICVLERVSEENT